MAFDGTAVSCIAYELNNLLSDGRVDKVLQPEFDEISLVIRSHGENYRLTASASASTPRIHLSKTVKENPIKAPLFCMLLRKHLLSGKVLRVYQPNFERVLIIDIESRDEMGDVSVKKLIIEIMGRCSNIVIVGGDGKILGSIKTVDFSVSTVRQLIPGMLYEMPPSQNKLNPMEITKEEAGKLAFSAENRADKFILDNFTGIGPLTAREIAFETFGRTDVFLSEISNNQRIRFAGIIYDYFQNIKNHKYSPTLLYKSEGKIWDFSPVEIKQYDDTIKCEKFENFNYAIDEYFSLKDKFERIAQKTSTLNKFIENNISRCQKKLALQQQKLKDCENKENYKVFGDLLTTNLYKIQPKSDGIILENYYDNLKEVKIKLKPELNPSQNAQRYYKLYAKCKNAEVMTNEQIKLTNSELDYLESVMEELLRAENEKDINEIRDELYTQGYKVKKNSKKGNKKQAISKPLCFNLSDDFLLYVGKNNIQNDELTLKTARSNDIWFHTKNIHGCHAIIKTDGRKPSDDVIVEAAKIAAFYSKAKNSANVPVDYTIVKNVKKPKGAKPGMVIYVNYNTVNVKPCNPN